ncbi:MAG: GTP cyclohydrolase, FolE2/MptA family, partial [Pseudoxanthomonas sp.]
MSASNPLLPRSDLPDVAGHAVPLARALDWVGMEGIALPIRVSAGVGGQLQVAASIDLSVNLAIPE